MSNEASFDVVYELLKFHRWMLREKSWSHLYHPLHTEFSILNCLFQVFLMRNSGTLMLETKSKRCLSFKIWTWIPIMRLCEKVFFFQIVTIVGIHWSNWRKQNLYLTRFVPSKCHHLTTPSHIVTSEKDTFPCEFFPHPFLEKGHLSCHSHRSCHFSRHSPGTKSWSRQRTPLTHPVS